jgi:Right handed beta helix region
MSKRRLLLIALTAAAAAAMPASAQAAVGWVSTVPVSAPYNSCSHPGYEHIQEALEGPVTSVRVCPGTYEEQLQVTRAVKIAAFTRGVTIKLPSAPVDATTPCDHALETATGEPVQDGVSICGAVKVSIAKISIEAAWPAGTCAGNLYGLNVGGGAHVSLKGVEVTAAGAQPINGCQGGVGIEVGTHVTSPEQGGAATLKEVTVSGYQKTGINVDGAHSSATMTEVTVTGAGATSVTAQNGIQVGYGASAAIKKSSVSDNEYEPETYAATGILLYGAAAGTSVVDTKVAHNDYGVYYEDAEASAPSSPQVKLSSDHIESSRYIAVFFVQGAATVQRTVMDGGEVGIALYQYEGQPYGFDGSGSDDTIEGMSVHAVQGYSDGHEGDPPGEFTIKSSKISGNPPGASVAESIYSESPTLKLTAVQDH